MRGEAICFFGYNGRHGCDSTSTDMVADGWYMALDSSDRHAQACYCCPNCYGQPPLCCFEPITFDPESTGTPPLG